MEQPPERNWESLCLSHSKLAWTRCWDRYATENNSATAIGLQWSNSSFPPLISVILELIITCSLWNLCSDHLLSLYITRETLYFLEEDKPRGFNPKLCHQWAWSHDFTGRNLDLGPNFVSLKWADLKCSFFVSALCCCRSCCQETEIVNQRRVLFQSSDSD